MGLDSLDAFPYAGLFVGLIGGSVLPILTGRLLCAVLVFFMILFLLVGVSLGKCFYDFLQRHCVKFRSFINTAKF